MAKKKVAKEQPKSEPKKAKKIILSRDAYHRNHGVIKAGTELTPEQVKDLSPLVDKYAK